MFTTKPSLLAVRISSRNRRCPALRFPREQPGFLVAWQQLWLAHLSFTLARNALSKEMRCGPRPALKSLNTTINSAPVLARKLLLVFPQYTWKPIITPGVRSKHSSCEIYPGRSCQLCLTVQVKSLRDSSIRDVFFSALFSFSSPSSPPLSFTSLAPSDSWRDADIGQSSYLGGDHNMDPAVVDSIACSHAKTRNIGVMNGVYYFYAVDVKIFLDVPGSPVLVDGSPADNDPRKVFIGSTILVS